MSACYIDCSPFMRALLTPDLARRLPGLRVHDEPDSPDAVVERLQGATVAINGHTPMPRDLLRRCPVEGQKHRVPRSAIPRKPCRWLWQMRRCSCRRWMRSKARSAFWAFRATMC